MFSYEQMEANLVWAVTRIQTKCFTRSESEDKSRNIVLCPLSETFILKIKRDQDSCDI